MSEVKKELDEPILPHDYPMYVGYLYVVDGKVVINNSMDMTPARLKASMGVSEVRRCDIAGRDLWPKDDGEKDKTPLLRPKQLARKTRRSHKLKRR